MAAREKRHGAKEPFCGVKVADKVGIVTVDMGDTSCKVPFAPEYIKKVIERGSQGKKRKQMRC